MKKRIVCSLLALLTVMAVSAPALAKGRTVVDGSYTVMNLHAAQDEDQARQITTIDSGVESETLKDMSEAEMDELFQAYLQAQPQLRRACSHSWVMKNREWVWYEGPTPSGGWHKGYAWVADYECSRCGEYKYFVMI